MKKIFILLGLSSMIMHYSNADIFIANEIPSPSLSANQTYIKARNQFKTHLIYKVKAPQSYEELTSSGKIEVVNYPSGSYLLKGLLDKSNIKKSKKSPVLVYLHGGFSLTQSDIEDTKPFIDKGFVVFAPSYRGENDNDGNFEMFMGEVEDAKSAVKWIAKQPYTDTKNIYVFGHSIGGAMSLHLAFFPELPIKQSGSSAGLYAVSDLKPWGEPFDITDNNEYKFRVPLLNLDKMAKNHVIYMGLKDRHQMNILSNNENYLEHQKMLDIKIVKGDHGSSLTNAMNAFIKTYYTP